MKRNVWLFIDKKTHLLVVMNFSNQKVWIGRLIGPSQNEKKNIDSHFKFVIGIQYMM
jgi:hypothetical protein